MSTCQQGGASGRMYTLPPAGEVQVVFAAELVHLDTSMQRVEGA